VAIESDGLTIGDFERYSAKKKKLSDEEWRKQVLDALDGAKGDEGLTAPAKDHLKNAANYLREHNWTDLGANPVDDDQALKGWLDHTRYSPGKDPYDQKGAELQDMPTHRDLWAYLAGLNKDAKKKHSLALEGDWQYQTSVSYTGNGKTTYVNPVKQPGIVRHPGAVDAARGSFVKITSDKNPDNPLRYARVLDSGDDKYEAELNIAAQRNNGAVDPNPATGGEFDPAVKSDAPDKVDVTPIAENPHPKNGFTPDEALDNENTQYAGWLAENKSEPYSAVSSQKSLDATMEKYKDDEDFKAYKKKVKDALLFQQARVAFGEQLWFGADHFVQGLDDVFCGDELRRVVVRTCLTKNGDKSAEGIWGVYGGPDRQPVSVVTNNTEKGQQVQNGAEHVAVGGPPTSTPDAKERIEQGFDTVSPFGHWRRAMEATDAQAKLNAAKTAPAKPAK
jgi:hypothetical protein